MNEPRRQPPARSGFLLAWALVATAGLLWLARAPERGEIPASWLSERLELPRPGPDRLVVAAAAWSDLPGWSEDAVEEALPALRRSCTHMRRRGAAATMRPQEVGGTVADWLPTCDALDALGKSGSVSRQSARAFFETQFAPLRVTNGERAKGTFTGYYEPLLMGSRRRTERFRIPLHAHPGDILSVDLGKFRDEWEGRSISGRWTGRTLEPYYDRSQIVDGALDRRRLELLWVDDPVDAFFLQIQGSGQVQLPSGQRIRVGYAGQNGHPYYAIGRELIVRGALQREEVSMQSIRAWLESNPQQADEVMSTNASYVFFRELRGDGPLGSQGVALAPGRSLAVDRTYIPMSAPVWLDTTRPLADEEVSGSAAAPAGASAGGWPQAPLRRLLIAQDTGGAIRGPVRGDVFWGAGERAASIAGRMNSRGQKWLLLPPSLAAGALAVFAAEQPAGDGHHGAARPPVEPSSG